MNDGRGDEAYTNLHAWHPSLSPDSPMMVVV
jgi:hypothetical protein